MNWFRAYYLHTAPDTVVSPRLLGLSVYCKKVQQNGETVYLVYDDAGTILQHSEADAKAWLCSYKTPAGKISVPNFDEQIRVERGFQKTQRVGSRAHDDTKMKRPRRQRRPKPSPNDASLAARFYA